MVQDIRIVEGADDARIAAWLATRLAMALAKSDAVAISLPGGSTPFPILERLTRDGSVDWSRIAVWPGDDRIVPEVHPASNAGRIRAFLEPLGATVVSLRENATPPHFALVWLGMGEDGHVASLFPRADPRVDERALVRRLTPDPLPPEAPFERLTLTLPALLDSEELLFVIRGTEKRVLFEAALRGENDLPIARLLGAANQPITCFT